MAANLEGRFTEMRIPIWRGLRLSAAQTHSFMEETKHAQTTVPDIDNTYSGAVLRILGCDFFRVIRHISNNRKNTGMDRSIKNMVLSLCLLHCCLGRRGMYIFSCGKY